MTISYKLNALINSLNINIVNHLNKVMTLIYHVAKLIEKFIDTYINVKILYTLTIDFILLYFCLIHDYDNLNNKHTMLNIDAMMITKCILLVILYHTFLYNHEMLNIHILST